MTAPADPDFALRPYLPADAPVLAGIFRASVAELTGDDYSEEQQSAWIEAADDEAAFAARLAGRLVLLATIEGEPVGFVSVIDNQTIDMLYVHPDVAREGAGSLLLDAAEKLAAAHGSRQLTVDASDTARGFFAHHGYAAQQRNSVACGDVWLANTTMTKRLAANDRRG